MKKLIILAVAAITFGFSAAQVVACGAGCSSSKDKGAQSAGAES